MAVGIRIKIPGVSAEQFDKLDAVIDVRGNRPDGLIFSLSGPIEGGWRVIDLWESRAQFDRFVTERVGPAMAAGGEPATQPDIAEFPVHEYFS